MLYRIVICDDDTAQHRVLERMVEKWAISSKRAVSVECFPSAEAYLFKYAEDKSADILLLDIEMDGMNGVELARTIRRGNREVQIIFITGYMEYIADGYDVEALNYLIKPVGEDKLFSVLDRATEKLRIDGRALILNLNGERVRIPLYQIRYIEARRNYAVICADREYTVKSTLSELEAELSEVFYRAGRSQIVNLRQVRRVGRSEICLADGTVLPLPRGQYDAVHRAMIERL